MSRRLADEILRLQAQLAWLRAHHSRAQDADVRALLDDVESLLEQALDAGDDGAALSAARRAVWELGAPGRRKVL